MHFIFSIDYTFHDLKKKNTGFQLYNLPFIDHIKKQKIISKMDPRRYQDETLYDFYKNHQNSYLIRYAQQQPQLLQEDANGGLLARHEHLGVISVPLAELNGRIDQRNAAPSANIYTYIHSPSQPKNANTRKLQSNGW